MADETQGQGNIQSEYNVARLGMNQDNSLNQVPKGQLTYALNAALENFDSNSVNYQNESGNEWCFDFPEGYQLVGTHFIVEKNKHIFFLANASTEESEIGYMENNDCIYRKLVNAKCLNFNVDHPIHKCVHRITNCNTEIYWTDGYNPRRYLDIEKIPYKNNTGINLCDIQYTNELDCNKLLIQPDFNIPNIEIKDVVSGGENKAGTYQFAVQYCDVNGNPYTSYYSVTNPLPLSNTVVTTLSFDYPVGKSIIVSISNLDITSVFQYFNLAVIKTINAITSVELVGTYFIDTPIINITYTGKTVTQKRLTVDDIFEKFPYYEIAQDVTTVRDVLVWDQLSSIDRISYQQIANQIPLNWETWRIPSTETYADELNAANFRGYLRDEVYAFEIVFLLKNGKQTDGFHIPGRALTANELLLPDIATTNDDFIGNPDYYVGDVGYSPYWKIYNTASELGTSPNYTPDLDYKGAYKYGSFAYWESTEKYSCDKELWGNLSDTPIRHHKFPDVRVSPIFESPVIQVNPNGTYKNLAMVKDAIYPIGVRLDVGLVTNLIMNSTLSQEQKDNIEAFKIVRGNRNTNRSVIAKGILRNVGTYERDRTTYLYPNYPYNDLSEDVFLLDKNNAYTLAENNTSINGVCRSFTITPTQSGAYNYIDCYTNVLETAEMTAFIPVTFCCLGLPIIVSGRGLITANTYKRWAIYANNSRVKFGIISPNLLIYQPNFITVANPQTPEAYCASNPNSVFCGSSCVEFINIDVPAPSGAGGYGNLPYFVDSLVAPWLVDGAQEGFFGTFVYKVQDIRKDICDPSPLKGFGDKSKSRHVFNSPETSFTQPFLGNVLKLESAIFGAGKAHFVPVKKHAQYKLLTLQAQLTAILEAQVVGGITRPINLSVVISVYQIMIDIYTKSIPRRNYAYSYNSIAQYSYNARIDNNLGIKQRNLDIAQYLIPGVQSVGDIHNINNYQRESSVYLKTNKDLPFPNQTPSLLLPGGIPAISDKSRMIPSERGNCYAPTNESPISVVSYYAALKNSFTNQYGQMYSYETIDTGFQRDINKYIGRTAYETVFGGDTFINSFTFKTKLPFFIDNRVNAPDDSDIFYDEIGNVAFPNYWFSMRSVYSNSGVGPYAIKNFFSYKAHNFDCPNKLLPYSPTNPNILYFDGKMFLFAYGIPSFYCESSINVDLRQAFNNMEGDFFPHVSSGIPDDWLQESFVTIAQDNTYHYNTTYSKQNTENFFSHLPGNWKDQLCYTTYPFRAIYSDEASVDSDNRINNWLKYKAVSYFDFPQNYGNLTSLDGIENKAVLARFENKTMLYNTMLTIDTNNPKAAYLGNDTLFKSSPPIDFAETDLGYVGSQHKFLLKIPQGQVTVDAKRGQVFLVSAGQAKELSAFGSGMNRFFTDHLAFEILRWFPKADVDNHFNGLGLHGVYDSKFDRVIITKLDYIPLSKDIKYDATTKEFTLNGNLIYLNDSEYFCNKSWTLSYNVNTNSWVSFHSYIPNWYIAENNFFYSGKTDCCADLEVDVNSFVVVAGKGVPQETTTTTTTEFPITTTTTTIPLYCDLEGTAESRECALEGTADEQYCALAGEAIVSDLTTTTTTSPPYFYE